MKIVDLVVAFDEKVDKAVDSIRSPAMDAIAYRLSSAADHGLLWHACGVTLRIVARRRPRRRDAVRVRDGC